MISISKNLIFRMIARNACACHNFRMLHQDHVLLLTYASCRHHHGAQSIIEMVLCQNLASHIIDQERVKPSLSLPVSPSFAQRKSVSHDSTTQECVVYSSLVNSASKKDGAFSTEALVSQLGNVIKWITKVCISLFIASLFCAEMGHTVPSHF